MKTFYALIHTSNNSILNYYPYASRQEDGSIILKTEQNEKEPILDEEGNPVLLESVIQTGADKVQIVEVEYNEETKVIVSAKNEEGVVTELNVTLDSELEWYLTNNGLLWVNNQIVKKYFQLLFVITKNSCRFAPY
jgi:hypothetical protein